MSNSNINKHSTKTDKSCLGRKKGYFSLLRKRDSDPVLRNLRAAIEINPEMRQLPTGLTKSSSQVTSWLSRQLFLQNKKIGGIDK